MTVKNAYLLLYNFVSLLLWAHLARRTFATLLAVATGASSSSSSQLPGLYSELMHPLLAGTQSLAALEVLHAALGIVRASPAATGLQVVGKNLVVWTVMARFPELVASPDGGGVWAFVGCLAAWSCSEVVRYGYFVAQLAFGAPPAALRWLRYNAFTVLYPLGLASEAWLVYLCLTRAAGIGALYRAYLFVGLLTYLPAGPFLYMHMLAQRVRAGGKPAGEKQ